MTGCLHPLPSFFIFLLLFFLEYKRHHLKPRAQSHTWLNNKVKRFQVPGIKECPGLRTYVSKRNELLSCLNHGYSHTAKANPSWSFIVLSSTNLRRHFFQLSSPTCNLRRVAALRALVQSEGTWDALSQLASHALSRWQDAALPLKKTLCILLWKSKKMWPMVKRGNSNRNSPRDLLIPVSGPYIGIDRYRPQKIMSYYVVM